MLLPGHPTTRGWRGGWGLEPRGVPHGEAEQVRALAPLARVLTDFEDSPLARRPHLQNEHPTPSSDAS